MKSPLPQLAAATLVAASLAACSNSSNRSSSSNPPVGTSRSNVAVEGMFGEENLWVLLVSEAGSGGTDLNGDGDTIDTVAHAYDAAADDLTNLKLAVHWDTFPRTAGELGPGESSGSQHADEVPPRAIYPKVNERWAVFAVSEADQGDRDLTGDGDALDDVLHVYDRTTGQVAPIPRAVAARGFDGFTLAEEDLVLAVSEEGEQLDLDGDGAIEGAALFHYPMLSGRLEQLPVNGIPGFQFTGNQLPLEVDESSILGDLNADRDEDDRMFGVYDVKTRLLSISSLEVNPRQSMFVDGHWILGARDGTRRIQYYDYDPLLRVATPLGISGSITQSPRVTGLTACIFGGEEEMGVDLNGDRDRLDHVLQAYTPSTGAVVNTGYALSTALVVEDALVLLVNESAEGADLNGDGDRDDNRLFSFDPLTNVSLDLGGGATGFGYTNGSESVISRYEGKEDRDLNGDGDKEDFVVFILDGTTLQTVNTGWAGGFPWSAADDLLVFPSNEFSQAIDENGDGDMNDELVVRYRISTGEIVALNFENPNSIFSPSLLDTGELLALVNETATGKDLNDDGDMLDLVFQRLDFPPAQ